MEYDQVGLPTRRTYFDEQGKIVPIEVSVREVLPKGQADRVGLKAGDVIVASDGVAVSTVRILVTRRSAEFDFSKKHELTVLRGGEKKTFSVLPGPLSVDLMDRAAAK